MAAHPPKKPSMAAIVSNWTTYDAPFFTKLGLALKNNAIKLRTRQSCCGNHGQPGC